MYTFDQLLYAYFLDVTYHLGLFPELNTDKRIKLKSSILEHFRSIFSKAEKKMGKQVDLRTNICKALSS